MRSQNDRHEAPHHFGLGFHDRDVLNARCQFLENFLPELAVSVFSSSKRDACLDLGSLFEEPSSAFLLDLEVVVLDVGPQPDFFDPGQMLVLLGQFFFLCLFVTVLAVIHDAADWRIGVRGDLDEVELARLRESERLLRRKNAHLLAGAVNGSDLRRTNLVVYADSSQNS